MHRTCRSKQLQHNRVRQHARAVHAYDFFNQLTNDDLLDVVEGQLPTHRERLFPPTTTLALFLAQTMNPDASCQATMDRHVVERLANGLPACSTATGAYCRARQRLPTAMVHTLLHHTGARLDRRAPATWRWHGHPVKLIDGSTVTLPDTPDDQACYPQLRTQQPGLGFPIARVVAILSLTSGGIIDAAMGPCKGKGASECALFHALLSNLKAGDVVLADRYYCSYVILALLQSRGVDAVFQQHQRRHTDFRTGQHLGPRDHVVTWTKPQTKPRWLSQAQFDTIAPTLQVREARVGAKVLVSTLLSPAQAEAKELKALYKQRWNVELDLRNLKTTLGLERLTCKTPAMNEKQWLVGLLAYNLIRMLMAESARRAGITPRQLSFKHSLQLWSAWSRSGIPLNDAYIIQLLTLIAQCRVACRPGRIEPRVLKRRPKPFHLLTEPRAIARDRVRKHGHPKKLK